MHDDLASIQEARDLLERAHIAQQAFRRVPQDMVDRVITAMAKAASAAAAPLARLAVDETGMGVYEDKITKNKFGSDDVLAYILPLQTVGIVREIPERKVKELAVPMGVVAALVPTTNPTSTAMYKSLISVKGRNAIVMSPHPRAIKCTAETARIMHDAAVEAGAPKDLILCMRLPTLEGTNELMRHKRTAVILATGGYPMVRAAYSSGKPAYGVGPGNVPAIVERTAKVAKAARDIINGKSFDNGVLCSAENSVIADTPIDAELQRELVKNGGHFVRGADRAKLQHTMQDQRSGGISHTIVGLSAKAIAAKAGITVPENTRALIAECKDTGPSEFFSREKLSPVLAYYVEDGWEACCERSIELLEFGGLGHSLVIHSHDDHVVQKFFEEKPAFRILVNTVSALGAVGFTTGLVPAMTLGPGTWAGCSTSDNIGPLHLINIKRMAGEVREYEGHRGTGAQGHRNVVPVPPCPSAPVPPVREISPAEVNAAVDSFLREHRAKRRQA